MTDVTAGGLRPSTTGAAVKALRCSQCVDCVNGPEPGRREETSPEGDITVTVPSCFSGSVYPRSGFAVCVLFRGWDL
jgi:hypothetical protein